MSVIFANFSREKIHPLTLIGRKLRFGLKFVMFLQGVLGIKSEEFVRTF